MTVPIKELFSERAKSAPGPYFPRPDHPVTYSFDQGSPVVRIHKTALATTRGSARGRPRRFRRTAGSSETSADSSAHSSLLSSSKNMDFLHAAWPGRGFGWTTDSAFTIRVSPSVAQICLVRSVGWSTPPCVSAVYPYCEAQNVVSLVHGRIVHEAYHHQGLREYRRDKCYG